MTKSELLQRLQDLVDISKSVHMEYHGRPDCKYCSLQEELERIIKEAQDT